MPTTFDHVIAPRRLQADHLHVLVLHADEVGGATLCSLLRDLSHDCLCASSISDALSLVGETTFDVAIIDISSDAATDGFLAAQLLRRAARLQALFVGDLYSKPLEVLTERLGIGYLTWPFSSHALQRALLHARNELIDDA
ncbi:hypothetical protein [Roseiterribacter gracilis]|uniref:Response regulatory domain-containing protein n=1 Tax=Roseiterribacter gracilis TaxID=2812848 RepID=A0A8S8XH19_9PROT|nr:hypothetical protein TMPK1_27930 [Rhodospirillales bacterium TMPK1]